MTLQGLDHYRQLLCSRAPGANAPRWSDDRFKAVCTINDQGSELERVYRYPSDLTTGALNKSRTSPRCLERLDATNLAPAGAEKKYKKCCVVEDEKNTRGLRAEHPAGGGGVARALSWLSARYCVESMEALERLAQPPSALVDAATGDPILLTNIHYRVRDWAPIEAALEADARIEPTGESNWTCFESTSADEPRRIVWTVSRRRNKKSAGGATRKKSASKCMLKPQSEPPRLHAGLQTTQRMRSN